MWSTELIQIYVKHLERGYESIFKQSPFYNNEPGLRRANLPFEMTVAEQDTIKNNSHPLSRYGGTINQHYQLHHNRFVVNKYCPIDRKLYCAFILDFVCRQINRQIVVAGDIKFYQVFLETYRLVPMFMKPGIVICNKEMIKFDNGNEIYFRPYSDKILSGVDANILIMLYFDTNRYHSHLNNVVYPTMLDKSNSKIILHSETDINAKLYDVKTFTNLIF